MLIKNCKNIDLSDEISIFKTEEINMCGEYLPVDIISKGDELPFEDNSVDFILSSHVIEHFKKEEK